MGKTIPSFRIATEMETRRWRPFRAALGKKERKIFDEMFDITRLYDVAGTTACRPVLIQTILISTIFEHYKRLTKLATDKIKNQK